MISERDPKRALAFALYKTIFTKDDDSPRIDDDEGDTPWAEICSKDDYIGATSDFISKIFTDRAQLIMLTTLMYLTTDAGYRQAELLEEFSDHINSLFRKDGKFYELKAASGTIGFFMFALENLIHAPIGVVSSNGDGEEPED